MPLLFFLFAVCATLVSAPHSLYCQVQYSRVDELPVCDEVYKTIRTIYGSFVVHEPVIWELLQSRAMQRLKKVHQYGISNYVDTHVKAYSRFDHSVGVWALLNLYKASLEEQIAGLLHDVSHTVFSHTGDYLFFSDGNEAYQDGIHEWYLKKQGVDAILQKYGIRLENILPKSGAHTALEQNLPDLCADRIEYNIQEGLMTGMIKPEQVPALLKTLIYRDGTWFFTDVEFAKKIAWVSLYGSVNQWGGPNCYIQNHLAAKALNRALELALISLDDIHFSEDGAVWNVLCESTDPILQDLMVHLKNYKMTFTITSKNDCNFLVQTKLRGVNPWIQLSNGTLKRLIELDDVYSAAYQSTKDLTTNGWPIRTRN